MASSTGKVQEGVHRGNPEGEGEERWATRYEFKAGFRKSVEIAKSRPGYKFGGFEDVERMTEERTNCWRRSTRSAFCRTRRHTRRPEGASSNFYDGVDIKPSDMPKILYDGWVEKLGPRRRPTTPWTAPPTPKKARLEADRDRIQAEVDKAREAYEKAERKKPAKAAQKAQK